MATLQTAAVSPCHPAWAEENRERLQKNFQLTPRFSRRQPYSNLSPNGLTVKDICDHFLTYQLQKVEAGAISARWFEDCRRVLDSLAHFFGPRRLVGDITPNDFLKFRQQLTSHGLTGKRGLGVHALNRAITVVRGMFKHVYELDLIDRQIKYGKAFERPSATLKRKARRVAETKNGKRLFESAEIQDMLKHTDDSLRAMILLGINGGFGNTDCARLSIKAVDWDNKVIEFDRPKTGIERILPLWDETMEALHKVLSNRPKSENEEYTNRVFLTTFGLPWVRDSIHRGEGNGIKKVVPVDSVGQGFTKLLKKLGLYRKGLGFYTLRHTFRTWADEVNDQHAIHRIMGHAIPGMSGIYVERISLERLRAVVDHVHATLFASE